MRLGKRDSDNDINNGDITKDSISNPSNAASIANTACTSNSANINQRHR